MKKIFLIALCLLVLAAIMVACGQQQSQTIQISANVDLETPFIGFLPEQPESINLDAYQRVSLEDIVSYTPRYAYGTRLYFDTISEQGQLPYLILQYALDHAQTSVYIDQRLLEGAEETIDEILMFLALDNAMLEQNLSWGYQDISISMTGSTGSTDVRGKILQIDEFAQGKLDKKLEALKKAEEIIAQMPQGLTDEEIAQWIYRYLGTHVEYFAAYGTGEKPDYLYDALCVGKTNCDGYANAYSLLCSLADIDCAEKMYTPEDPKEIGHTWNLVNLGDTWYNVDATGSHEVRGEYGIMSHFCVADDRMEYTYSYKDRLPACDQNLIQPDCVITGSDDAADAVKQAYDTIRNTDRNYILVLFAEGEQDSDTMRDIANTLGMSITTQYYITGSGDAVYYIFPEK